MSLRKHKKETKIKQLRVKRTIGANYDIQMQGSPLKQMLSIKEMLSQCMHSCSPIESMNILQELNFLLSSCEDSHNKDDILLSILESDVYSFLANMYI